jgi:hypothetical protein
VSSGNSPYPGRQVHVKGQMSTKITIAHGRLFFTSIPAKANRYAERVMYVDHFQIYRQKGRRLIPLWAP